MSDTIHEETEHLQFRDPNQPNLHTVYWTRGTPTEKACANLLIWHHGLGEHSARHKSLARDLLLKTPLLDGVISYDMRNHGLSDGGRGAMRSINDLVCDLRDLVLPRAALRYGQEARVVLGGHSLGGLVAAGVATKRDGLKMGGFGHIVGVLLSAPAVEIFVKGFVNRGLRPFAGIVGKVAAARGVVKGNGIAPELLCRDEKVVEEYQKDKLVHGMVSLGVASDLMVFGKEVLRSVSQAGETDMVFHNVRTLVLHGGADGVVDVRGSRSLVDAITKVGKTEATLIELDGAFHEAHNEKSNMGGDDFRHHASNFLTGCFEAASDLKLPEDEDE